LVAHFAAQLTRTAKLLAGLGSDKVALELLNEPWTSGMLGALRWQSTLQFYYSAARRGSSDLTLILSGGDGGSANGLVDVDPSPFLGDSHVVFTFHTYAPLVFTMQGEPGPKTADLTGVPYPFGPQVADATIEAIRARIDKETANPDARAARLMTAVAYLRWTLRQGEPAISPARNVADVARWADRYRIPHERILLGEFGVARDVGKQHGAPEADRLRWIADVRALAERTGFPWAYWVYRGYSGMMLVRAPGSDDFDTGALKALGLRDPAPSTREE
jgi:hypothetical protein